LDIKLFKTNNNTINNINITTLFFLTEITPKQYRTVYTYKIKLQTDHRLLAQENHLQHFAYIKEKYVLKMDHRSLAKDNHFQHSAYMYRKINTY